MTTGADKMDKHLMLSSQTYLPEPFDFGRTVVKPSLDSVSSGPEEDKRDSNPDVSLLHQFADETSAHGCAHVASSYRGTFSRLSTKLARQLPTVCRGLWLVAVGAMLCAMVYTLYSMLAAYDEYPVNTLTKITVKHALPFPGVTFCNINEVDATLVPFNATVYKASKVGLKFDIVDYENDTAVTEVYNTPISNIVNSSWILPSHAFPKCSINNEVIDCAEIFTPLQNSRTKCVTLKTEHPELKAMSNAGPISGLRLYLNVHQNGYVYDNSVSAGIKMYIHDPRQPPDFHTSGSLMAPGFSHHVSTQQTDYSFLPKPYMAYGDEPCVDVEDPSFSRRLRLAQNYSFHMCSLQCTVDRVADLCGCRGVLNTENSSIPMCTMRQFYTCYDRHLSSVYFNVSSDNKCNCPRPCKYTEYRTQISSAYFPSNVAVENLKRLGILPDDIEVRESYMELRVYLAKLVLEEVVHEAVYTYTSVMGTIGGQMGFFLGASVLTVAEVVELLVCFVFRFLRNFSAPRERKGRSRVIPVQPATQTKQTAAAS